METIECESWEEALREIDHIRALIDPRRKRADTLLFRGQGDSDWALSTTLERTGKVGMPVVQYYRRVFDAKTEIECFTDRRWETPSLRFIRETFSEYDKGSRHLIGKGVPAADYLSHLRHHGFPTPIMDWSASQFVAAFFAFRDSPQSDSVAIFVYEERAGVSKTGGNDLAYIRKIGKNIRTHRRHYLQRSQYTVCMEHSSIDGWIFQSHERVFEEDELEQDRLWKICIPTTERSKVLRVLDGYNLNAYSLFGSEESLMQTIAARTF